MKIELCASCREGERLRLPRSSTIPSSSLSCGGSTDSSIPAANSSSSSSVASRPTPGISFHFHMEHAFLESRYCLRYDSVKRQQLDSTFISTHALQATLYSSEYRGMPILAILVSLPEIGWSFLMYCLKTDSSWVTSYETEVGAFFPPRNVVLES